MKLKWGRRSLPSCTLQGCDAPPGSRLGSGSVSPLPLAVRTTHRVSLHLGSPTQGKRRAAARAGPPTRAARVPGELQPGHGQCGQGTGVPSPPRTGVPAAVGGGVIFLRRSDKPLRPGQCSSDDARCVQGEASSFLTPAGQSFCPLLGSCTLDAGPQTSPTAAAAHHAPSSTLPFCSAQVSWGFFKFRGMEQQDGWEGAQH